MGLMSYTRVGSGRSGGSSSSSSSSSSCTRGFKLNPKRLYVLRLRKRFNFFLTLFHKCKLSYSQALLLLKKVFRRKLKAFRSHYSSSSSNTSSSCSNCDDCNRVMMMRSYGRSNSSFYAEAIADCLEFIKRTSISMDQIHHQDPPVLHIQQD